MQLDSRKQLLIMNHSVMQCVCLISIENMLSHFLLPLQSFYTILFMPRKTIKEFFTLIFEITVGLFKE